MTFMNQAPRNTSCGSGSWSTHWEFTPSRRRRSVDSNSSVAGIHTEFDSVPVVRAIVRNYALSQRKQKEAQANQEAEQKIRQAACSRVDSQIDPRLAQVERNFRERLLKPLEKLGLKPAINRWKPRTLD